MSIIDSCLKCSAGLNTVQFGIDRHDLCETSRCGIGCDVVVVASRSGNGSGDQGPSPADAAHGAWLGGDPAEALGGWGL